MHITFIMERFHSMLGEVSTVWRGVHSMHIAFIMERCPQYGKVSILCKDVLIMQRCLK